MSYRQWSLPAAQMTSPCKRGRARLLALADGHAAATVLSRGRAVWHPAPRQVCRRRTIRRADFDSGGPVPAFKLLRPYWLQTAAGRWQTKQRTRPCGHAKLTQHSKRPYETYRFAPRMCALLCACAAGPDGRRTPPSSGGGGRFDRISKVRPRSREGIPLRFCSIPFHPVPSRSIPFHFSLGRCHTWEFRSLTRHFHKTRFRAFGGDFTGVCTPFPRQGGPPSTLHRAPVGQGPSGPDWLAIAFGFWAGRALATGTAWAGLCLIHHHLGSFRLICHLDVRRRGALFTVYCIRSRGEDPICRPHRRPVVALWWGDGGCAGLGQ